MDRDGKAADSFSRSASVTIGVSQGSVLRPQLFLFYIKHVVSFSTCGYRIFEDNIKLYFSYNDSDVQTRSSLQCDIDLLTSTSSLQGLNINASICAVIRFAPRFSSLLFTAPTPYTVNRHHITFTASHSDLGVSNDRSLKFHNHIRSNITSVSGLKTNLLMCTVCREPDFRISLYLTHVRGLMDNASAI